MKRAALLMLVMILLVCGFDTTFVKGETLESIIKDYEPRPFDRPSLNENKSFNRIEVSPTGFMETIRKSKNAQDIWSYFSRLGLEVGATDCEFIHQYKDNAAIICFELDDAISNIEKVVTISYGPIQTNILFVFCLINTSYVLIDDLGTFSNAQLLVEAHGNTAWLVGEVGDNEFRTVRWYNLDARKFDLSYLAHGVMADRSDYHIKVQTTMDTVFENVLPEDGLLALRKQMSVYDLTQTVVSAEASERLVLTQVDVLKYDPSNNCFELLDSQPVP